MGTLNIFDVLPEGYKRLEGPEDYELARNTVAKAFAGVCYPIPSMLISHEEYMKLYGELAYYWLDHSLENGDVIANEDISAVLILSPIDKTCDLPMDEVKKRIRGCVDQAAMDNALGILSGACEDEKALEVEKNGIFIEILAVLPDKHGTGLGGKIMNELFKECDKQGRDIALLTNSAKNVLLYQHLGFEYLYKRESKELDTVYNYMVRHAVK